VIGGAADGSLAGTATGLLSSIKAATNKLCKK